MEGIAGPVVVSRMLKCKEERTTHDTKVQHLRIDVDLGYSNVD